MTVLLVGIIVVLAVSNILQWLAIKGMNLMLSELFFFDREDGNE